MRKKLDAANLKINELESKQKDTNKILSTTNNSDKRIGELELALSKLRQQNEQLQKRIKDDVEKKQKLEKDFEKEQQKLKDLETRSEQQQKILKKKTEDLATAQRRLRSASKDNLAAGAMPLPVAVNTEESNKHWAEVEMEKILIEKRQLEMQREELRNRESILRKKEAIYSNNETTEHDGKELNERLASSINKLNSIPHEESKHLLKKFFQRIIDLKDAEYERQSEISELQVKKNRI